MSQGGAVIKPRGRRKTWSIKYRDQNKQQQWEGKFATKSDAQRRLTEVLHEIDTGRYRARAPITFERFSEQWMKGRLRIRGSTESGYGSIIKAQLIPRLGPLALLNIRLEHIQQMVTDMIEDELSTKTIHNSVTLLRSMLTGRKSASATRLGHICVDPTAGLELPILETRQIEPPSPEQVWALIHAAEKIGGIGHPATYLAAFTGLRRNEALAARFDDVEWFTHELRIRQAVSKTKSTDGAHKWQWMIGPPKSRKSNRRIHLTESVMQLLAHLKQGAGSQYILPGVDGNFLDPDKFDAEVWAPIAAAAGMEGMRYHDLRHFFASQLIAQGESAAYVRDQMGHSSIQITFDTYGHLFPAHGKEASARLEASMAKARSVGSNLVAHATPESKAEVAN